MNQKRQKMKGKKSKRRSRECYICERHNLPDTDEEKKRGDRLKRLGGDAFSPSQRRMKVFKLRRKGDGKTKNNQNQKRD